MARTTTKKSEHRLPNYPGQHFMHNKRLLQEIVDHAGVGAGDTVLDLGAGTGALTTILSERACKVIAVEYDPKLITTLKSRTETFPNTKVIQQDILNLRLPKEKFTVVSNIPYSITTPIMKKLLSNPASSLQRAVLVMEEGAARRFTSSCVKDPYVLAWRMWFVIRYVRDVARTNFSPPPKVDSAIVTITRRRDPIVPYKDYLTFWGLADYMLANPRLPLDLALQGVFTPVQLKQLKRNLGCKDNLPVASLSESHWGVIYRTMIQHVPSYRWPRLNRRRREQYFFR